MVERQGFEPWVLFLTVRRFSKPLPSASRAPLHINIYITDNISDKEFCRTDSVRTGLGSNRQYQYQCTWEWAVVEAHIFHTCQLTQTHPQGHCHI